MSYKRVWTLLRQTFSAWSDHEAPRLAAALAFYTILSLAPLVLLVVAIVATFVGRSSAQTHIVNEVQNTIGQQGADAIRGMIEQGQKPAQSAFASIIGVLTLLFGASGVFGELRSALNKIWDVKPPAGTGIWGMIRQQFFSFGMVLAVGFLLLVSLVLSSGLAALGKFCGGLLPVPVFVLSATNFVISLIGISILFALIFRYIPETRIDWKDVWQGAVVTAFLFTLGKHLIGLYLGKAAVGSAYGVAGSLVVVIVWVYYSSIIFLFGAEFTHELQQPANGQIV